MDWLICIVVFLLGGIAYWFFDDYIQRPMSKWTKDQIDAAFIRNPHELSKYVIRGSMSRKEWISAIERRNLETRAELAKRGIK